MNNKRKLISILALVALSQTSLAKYLNGDACIGVDALYSMSSYKQGFGKEVFAKQMPAANVYAGYYFNKNFGIELGHERQYSKSRDNVKINSNGPGLGVTTNGSFVILNSKTNQNHTYLGGVARTNVFNEATFVSFMIGGSISHVKASYRIFMNAIEQENTTRNFSKTKLVPVVRVAIEHYVNNNLGIRALLGWKGTSSLKAEQQEPINNNKIAQVRLKNTTNVGIGLVFKI